jgi:hypothetical protein
MPLFFVTVLNRRSIQVQSFAIQLRASTIVKVPVLPDYLVDTTIIINKPEAWLWVPCIIAKAAVVYQPR